MNLLRRKLQGQELSPPELEVLRAAAEGLSAAETASRLVKSEHTIVTQRRAIQAKLGARNLPHAVALAYRLQVLPLLLNQRPTDARAAGSISSRK